MTWVFHIIYCVYVYMLWFICSICFYVICLLKQAQTFITCLLLCVCNSVTLLPHASLVNKLKREKQGQTN